MATRRFGKPPFAAALLDIRYHLQLTQAEMAAKLAVARRTLSRWEMGDSAPSGLPREALVTLAATLPAHLGDALLRALGAPVPAPAPPPPVVQVAPPPASEAPARPATPPSPDAAKRAIDDAIFAAAELLDVGPRSLRRALESLLGAIEATGLPLAAARTLVAGEPPTKAPTT